MITVRPVTSADCALLWRWVNDPDVRASAFRTAPIPWEEHERWFAARLASESTSMFIVLDGPEPAGQVRFDVDAAGIARVDISIAPEKRGAGLAGPALRAAIEAFRNRRQVAIEALVRPGNDRSLRAFAGAGFVRDGTERVGDVDAVRLRLTGHAQ